MDCYPENTSICNDFEVVDTAGNPYKNTCHMDWSLYDSEGNVLSSGSSDEVEWKVHIPIPAELNRLSDNMTKDLRRVVVKFSTLEDGSLISAQESSYFIRSETPLIIGKNSFVTYEGYRLIASMIPHLSNMADATEDQIVIALQEAHDRLMGLRFRLSYSTRQENVGYVSEVAWRPRAITDDDPLETSSYRFKLDEVTEEDFKTLPEKFRKALAKAQVYEADNVMAPTDSIEERRRKGVILETINEVKMMFSGTVPVNQKISREAMRVLAPFLDTTVRIRRV